MNFDKVKDGRWMESTSYNGQKYFHIKRKQSNEIGKI